MGGACFFTNRFLVHFKINKILVVNVRGAGEGLLGGGGGGGQP